MSFISVLSKQHWSVPTCKTVSPESRQRDVYQNQAQEELRLPWYLVQVLEVICVDELLRR